MRLQSGVFDNVTNIGFFFVEAHHRFIFLYLREPTTTPEKTTPRARDSLISTKQRHDDQEEAEKSNPQEDENSQNKSVLRSGFENGHRQVVPGEVR